MTTKTDTQAAFEKWLGARADDPSLPHGLMRDAFCAGVEADRQGRTPTAWLTRNEDGDPAMLFFDRAEALTYCADGVDPEPLVLGADHFRGVTEMVPSDEELLGLLQTCGALTTAAGIRAIRVALSRYGGSQSAALDFHIDSRNGFHTIVFDDGSRRSASEQECALWDALMSGRPADAGAEPCFCDRMYPDSNPDATCGDCPRDYRPAASAEPYAYIRTVDLGNGNTQVDLIAADIVGDLSQYTDIVSFEPLFRRAAPVAQEPVAYLDLGVGGYMDVGTDLTDEQLAALPKGRHMLAIIGTHGVDGYVAAPVAAQVQPGDPHKSLFEAAIRDLAAISEHLGLDPDDGGAVPIIEAINELRSERDQWADAGYAAQAQPCDHVYEARPIDGSRRASVPVEAVCRKCGARGGASLMPDMQRDEKRGAESGRDREDAERMDWIIDNAGTRLAAPGLMCVSFIVSDSEDIRQAIDAARAAKGADHG